jgi:H+/Cl- antiporter ClcA
VAHELPHAAAVPTPDLLLELAAALFLVACAAAGFGVTYLSGVPLDLEERVVFGAVLGAMLVAATTFVPALLLRDVTPLTAWFGLLAGLVLGGAGAFAGRRRVLSDWADARRRWPSSWPLLVVLVVCGAWTVHFLHQAYVYTPAGLFAG